MTDKIIIGSSIIIFWLAFGFFMGFVYPSSANDYKVTIEQKINSNDLSIGNVIKSISIGFEFFFKGLFVIIPGIPLGLKVFVYSMQIFSLVFIIFSLMDSLGSVLGGLLKIFGL